MVDDECAMIRKIEREIGEYLVAKHGLPAREVEAVPADAEREKVAA